MPPGAGGHSSTSIEFPGKSRRCGCAANVSWDGDVATFGGMRAVWFADPDGNIINLESSS